MRTLRIPVAIAASCGVLFAATASSAEDTEEEATEAAQPAATQPATAQPAPTQPTTAQPGHTNQPQQPTVIVITPPASQPPQGQPPQVGQSPVREPVGRTRLTQAQYMPPAREVYGEREVERRPNGTLLSTGTGLFIMSYGPSVVAGAMSDREEDKRLFIPVAGPWLDLNNRDCRANPCGETEDVAKAMIITSGVVQGAGVLMALGSLLIPETTTVSERRTTEAAEPSVKILPVSFAAGAGVGAIGRF